jgi:hypothetical protein
MEYVTKSQIERAREMNVLDYVIHNEHDKIKRVGNSYRLKDHDSLAINENGFYWHSRGFGSKSALDFLVKVRDYDFIVNSGIKMYNYGD